MNLMLKNNDESHGLKTLYNLYQFNNKSNKYFSYLIELFIKILVFIEKNS